MAKRKSMSLRSRAVNTSEPVQTDIEDKPAPSPTPSAPKKTAQKRTQKAVSRKTSVKKVVRDIFSAPQDDMDLLKDLQKRCAMTSGETVNKSELLRAGIQALNKMSDTQLVSAVSRVEKLKTGRPKK